MNHEKEVPVELEIRKKVKEIYHQVEKVLENSPVRLQKQFALSIQKLVLQNLKEFSEYKKREMSDCENQLQLSINLGDELVEGTGSDLFDEDDESDFDPGHFVKARTN